MGVVHKLYGYVLIAFSPLEAWVAPLDTVGANPHEGGFYVSSISDPLSTGPETSLAVTGVLPSSSERKPRPNAIASIVL